ncbi:hypothetical protein A5642_20550 [Mycolicibacterium mucogenicum]|uniref:Scaffolding protein n=1 Tax=Mycolicibacterium mucogenicum TaxID=56689 RepID=A0A1A0MQR5_MYCMU|nr:hypothetical protein [Mycolicibacterium mucogenicum]OBA87128.1 hypothetical protein A5642_20550 [Mycolicibacterium mucogenicum]
MSTDISADAAPENETPSAATDPDTPVEAPSVAAEPPEVDSGIEGPDDGNGNREAAKYRRKLRETEAERDTLVQRLESMQRAEAERLAGEHLAKGVALWLGDTALADLLNGDGNVDPDKVAHRASQVRDEFGLYPPNRKQNVVPREGENPQAGRRSTRDQMINAVMGFHD